MGAAASKRTTVRRRRAGAERKSASQKIVGVGGPRGSGISGVGDEKPAKRRVKHSLEWANSDPAGKEALPDDSSSSSLEGPRDAPPDEGVGPQGECHVREEEEEREHNLISEDAQMSSGELPGEEDRNEEDGGEEDGSEENEELFDAADATGWEEVCACLQLLALLFFILACEVMFIKWFSQALSFLFARPRLVWEGDEHLQVRYTSLGLGPR
ncbi:hypothetical protein VTG60DRAFT_5617 [Thermothelomyces hinnuleus]